MKTKKINELTAKLDSFGKDALEVRVALQKAYNEYFQGLRGLQKDIVNAESASEYSTDKYGEIISWYRSNLIDDFEDCREYFEEYVRDYHCMEVDFENSCFQMNQGESIIIQDDARRGDNGVWLNSKMIIDQNEYTDDDGEVNESKRNEMIEAYMEKTGFYPGVFNCDQNGNVFFVNTQSKKRKKAKK